MATPNRGASKSLDKPDEHVEQGRRRDRRRPARRPQDQARHLPQGLALLHAHGRRQVSRHACGLHGLGAACRSSSRTARGSSSGPAARSSCPRGTMRGWSARSRARSSRSTRESRPRVASTWSIARLGLPEPQASAGVTRDVPGRLAPRHVVRARRSGPRRSACPRRARRGRPCRPGASSKSKTSALAYTRSRVHRLRDHHEVVLQRPADQHLRGRLAVARGDAGHHVGSSSRRPRVSGLYASSWMPRPRQYSRRARW